MHSASRIHPGTLCTCVLAVLLAGAAHAQQVYRIIGPDGKVTFSDRAPQVDAQEMPLPRGGGASADAGNTLPASLRQVASRYPVTLYTSNDCAPCTGGRALLVQRGIPFAERTVNTASDIDALKGISGGTSLPLLTIGTQQLKGFSDIEWSEYLDAAGYPRQSQLPASYRRAPATPLVTSVPKAAAPAVSTPSPPSNPMAPRPATPSPANPGGIVF